MANAAISCLLFLFSRIFLNCLLLLQLFLLCNKFL